MHCDPISLRALKRGKKYTLKMPLERMKKFLSFKFIQLTE
jgi:hypothetical protein